METKTPNQESAQELQPDTPIFSWKAPVMLTHERSQRWYLVAGISVLTLAAISVLMGAWTFTIVIVLVSGVYFLVHRSPAVEKTIDIRTQSVVFDGIVTRWKDCEGFWMIQGKDYVELHIAKKPPLKGEIMLQTGQLDPFQVRGLLLNFLPELANRKERLLDTLIRICKI